MRNYNESLNVAQKLYTDNTSSLWVIVSSYYSMFYLANAVLYKLGYKVGDKIAHKITSDALIVLVKDKLSTYILNEYEIASEEALLISNNLIENYDFERIKRSKLQYESTEEIKISKARTSLDRAKRFALELENYLEKL